MCVVVVGVGILNLVGDECCVCSGQDEIGVVWIDFVGECWMGCIDVGIGDGDGDVGVVVVEVLGSECVDQG